MDLPPLDRRQFLRYMGIATVTTGLNASSLFAGINAVDSNQEPLHIIIVGAGLAGLCAAYELEQRGHRCTILEADKKHIGGRARTLRFENGLYGEAGAMRIPKTHDLPRKYIKDFGLELRHFVYSNPNAYYFLRGMLARISDEPNLRHLYKLTSQEKQMSPGDMWDRAITQRLRRLTKTQQQDLFAITPKTRAIQQLDQKSLAQLFREAGFSEEATEYGTVASGSEAILDTGASEFLREEQLDVWTSGFDEIVGGTDKLPGAFVEHLKSKPKSGCEVIKLEQGHDGKTAAAVYMHGHTTKRVEGDFLICTLPFSVLGRLDTEPAFSGPKQRAIRELHYDSSTKVLAVTKQRFWESKHNIYGGGTFTDLPTGMTYYPSDNAINKDPKVSAGPGVMLASYSWGQDSRRLSDLDYQEREKYVMHKLKPVHPELADKNNIIQTASWSWDRFKWNTGAFAWFMPGQFTSLHKDIISPEGRIYFAGEHTSLVHTWMQGALESALVAVKDILETATKS